MSGLPRGGLDVEQWRTMDGDGRVRRVVPSTAHTGFYGKYPVRTINGIDVSDVSIAEVDELPDADYRPWYEKDETGGTL